jgi:hypothetical protein
MAAVGERRREKRQRGAEAVAVKELGGVLWRAEGRGK